MNNKVASSGLQITSTVSDSSGGTMIITRGSSAGSADAGSAAKKVEGAVYAYIQAVRALGRTTIHTEEIAKALGLPVDRVDATLDALKKKGVKVLA